MFKCLAFYDKITYLLFSLRLSCIYSRCSNDLLVYLDLKLQFETVFFNSVTFIKR